MVDLISDLFHEKELKCQLLSNEKGRSFPREADARTVVANLGVLLLGGPDAYYKLLLRQGVLVVEWLESNPLSREGIAITKADCTRNSSCPYSIPSTSAELTPEVTAGL